MNNATLRFGILLAIAVALIACGGGGSSQAEVVMDTEQPEIPLPPSLERKPAPGKIFHSARALSDDITSPTVVEDAINSLEHVEGTLVKVSWNQIHLADGVFEFGKLDDEFAKAEELNSKISLVVFDGKDVPDFVAAECETFEYQFRIEFIERACLPWDESYQSHKQNLLDALGERFDSHEALANVYITYAAMTNGAEMHWRVDELAYTVAGYTQEKLIQSYQDVTDFYVAAFPTTPLSMEVHEVFGSGALAEQAYDHCFDQIGEYCGVAMWWCAERMTTQEEAEVWPVVQLATTQSFAVCQTVGNFTNQPDRFATNEVLTPLATLQNEVGFFFGEGVTVWELWTADITNPEFEQEIIALKTNLEDAL